MITLDITDNIAEVTLNAPEKMNALDEQAVAELGQAYTDAAEAGVRALLLRGEGRGFSAGRDISNVDPADDDAYDYLGKIVTPVLRQMAEFPAPTFAAVQGACLGVGLGLAIATDVVYVANDAKIGSPFANLGATLDSGGHALFTERLGVVGNTATNSKIAVLPTTPFALNCSPPVTPKKSVVTAAVRSR